MNVDYINPFIHGTQNILTAVYGKNTTLGKLFIKKVPFTCEAVSIGVGIKGDISGQVIYTMKEDMLYSIVSHMMGGMSVDQMDEISISAICELGNMISGNVATLLSSEGKLVDITPPSFKLNSGSADYPQIELDVPVVCIPLRFDDNGVFEIYICFRD